MSTKICTKCKLDKPLSDFYKLTRAPDGHQYHCKACSAVYVTAWLKRHPEYSRRKEHWRKRNRAKYNAYMREYMAKRKALAQ